MAALPFEAKIEVEHISMSIDSCHVGSLTVKAFKKDAVLMEFFDDGLPEKEQLAATEGTDVVSPLEEDRILELVSDGAGVVLDAS